MVSTLFLAAAAAASPTSPPSPPPAATPVKCDRQEGEKCSVKVSVPQIFAFADQLADQHHYDEAIAFLKPVTQDRNADYRAEARVRIARALILKGDLWGAVHWYQQLLNEKPDAAAVRIELAQLLARLGNEAAAAGQLRRAEAAGLPDAVSRSLRQARDFLKSQSPFGFNVSFGFAPDSNINTATTADTVTVLGLPATLNQAAKAHSGVGLTYSGDIVARVPLAPGLRWISQVGSNGNLYRDSQFDDISLSFDSGPELSLGRSSIRPAILAGRRYYLSDWLYTYHGFSVAAILAMGKKAQINLGITRVQFDYTPLYAYQSGPVTTIRAGYDRALSPRLVAHIGMVRSRSIAEIPSYGLTSLGGEISLRRDFKDLSLYASASTSHAVGDAPFFLFDAKRNDHSYEGDIGLIFRRISWHGLSPQIKGMYLRNDSPLTLYEYRRFRGEISLTGSF